MYLIIHGAKLQIFLNRTDRIFKDKITKITDYATESNLHVIRMIYKAYDIDANIEPLMHKAAFPHSYLFLHR